MSSLTVVLLVLFVLLGTPLVWMKWKDWRRDQSDRGMERAFQSAEAALPPITPEAAAEGGAHRACNRALLAWADAETRCPACGATAPPPVAAAPVAGPVAEPEPVPPPRARGTERLEGALTKRTVEGTRGSMRGRNPFQMFGFSSTDHSIACRACGWQMAFSELHGGPPMPGPELGTILGTEGPRRRWTVRSWAGAEIGVVSSGGGQPVEVGPAASATDAERAIVHLAGLLVGTVVRVDLGAVAPDVALAMRASVVKHQLGLRAGKIELGSDA